jgi:hypothetical protein
MKNFAKCWNRIHGFPYYKIAAISLKMDEQTVPEIS